MLRFPRLSRLPGGSWSLRWALQFRFPKELVWSGLLSPSLLESTAQPFVQITHLNSRPKRYEEGMEIPLRVSMGGITFCHLHRIVWKHLDPKAYSYQTEESSDRFPIWNHSVHLYSDEHGGTRVEETLTLKAVRGTLFFLVPTWIFYQVRRNKLKTKLKTFRP
jgi:hypothetical protein